MHTNMSYPAPISGTPMDALNAGLVGFLNALILRVFRVSDFAQIANSVVAFVTVDVVKDAAWKDAMHIKPSQSVRPEGGTIDFDDSITLLSPTGYVACECLAVAGVDSPPKDSGFWIVMKKFAQTLRGKIGLSHDAVLSLIGQRPACVGSTCGLRYFK